MHEISELCGTCVEHMWGNYKYSASLLKLKLLLVDAEGEMHLIKSNMKARLS